MQKNNSDVTGVFHQQKAKENYQLRRYFPESAFSDLIEQFWFVNWDLPDNTCHCQKNLPDANFHLIFDHNELKLLGPVSKTYHYEMSAKGQVLGVKFKLGTIHQRLNLCASDCIDKEFNLQKTLMLDTNKASCLLSNASTDSEYVEILQQLVSPLVTKPSKQLLFVWEAIEIIKTQTDIYKVEQLSERLNVSIRTIQRAFQLYVGLSPKWLIRKYRLHQLLKELDINPDSISHLIDTLGYTDQAHLINDFKNMLGLTPKKYRQIIKT